MQLHDILERFSRHLTLAETSKPAELTLQALTADSRQVEEGCLFVAIRGVKQNGEDYIDAAIAAGAAAILTHQDYPDRDDIVHLKARNERQVLAKLAAAFYPNEQLKTVAVTGTNGKTSTAEFFRQLLEGEDKKAASIGTMGLGTNSVKGLEVPALNTSPDPVLLHQTLQQLEQVGCDAVALEASSHGLHQHRIDGVKLTAAAFTNLTRDHLDYHKTEKAYFEAKLRLFAYVLPRGQLAVLNRDDRYYSDLEKMCRLRKHQILTFGTQANANLQLTQLTRHGKGMTVRLNLIGQQVEVDLPLIGDFQIMNILVAIGLAHGCGYQIETLIHGLRNLKPVRGRMEQAAEGIYIDYAHTPDALEKALKTMRQHCSGKLTVVMGCGGDRDAGKRVPMGRVVSDLADRVIVTDDNPRTEDALEIRKQVLAGASGKHCEEVADRHEAIAAAIAGMEPDDMLLIAGKGHETYQIIGTERQHFDDAEVVREVLD